MENLLQQTLFCHVEMCLWDAVGQINFSVAAGRTVANCSIPGALELFPPLHQFGFLPTRCAPQWKESSGRDYGNASPAACCTFGDKNETILHGPLSAQSRSTAQHLGSIIFWLLYIVTVHPNPLWNSLLFYTYDYCQT